MCTVTWIHQPGGYHLLCNRDEKLTRSAALAPTVIRRGGVKYVAPVDAEFGGTWLSVNEFGVSVCLLNGRAEARTIPAVRSRGLLLRELAWASTAGKCVLWLKQLDLNPFAPFVLLILEPGQPAAVAEWRNEVLSVDPAGDTRMPLTSSSYDPDGVRRFRLDEFARRAESASCVDSTLLYEFHSSHLAAADAYSPCMHRDDAETVSFSWVTVTRDEIRFLYSPAAPCRHSQSAQQVLPRAA